MTTFTKPTGIPTYFFAACCEAAQGGARCSYRWAARTLAGHLGSLQPNRYSTEQWEAALEDLGRRLEGTNTSLTPNAACNREPVAAIWAWFREHLPNLIRLVPSRRKATFLAGILEAAEDDAINWEVL